MLLQCSHVRRLGLFHHKSFQFAVTPFARRQEQFRRTTKQLRRLTISATGFWHSTQAPSHFCRVTHPQSVPLQTHLASAYNSMLTTRNYTYHWLRQTSMHDSRYYISLTAYLLCTVGFVTTASPSIAVNLNLFWLALANVYALFLPVASPTIAGISIPFSDTVKTLGVTLDQHLTLSKHVSSLSRNIHFYARALRHMRPTLTESIAATLDASLVQSRLDYANSIQTWCNLQVKLWDPCLSALRCLIK